MELNSLTSLTLSTYQPTERAAASQRDAALWSACQDFEALFTQQLLRAMSSTLSSGSLFGESAGSSMYQELYETELAKAMSKSGSIGIAEVLYKQMERQNRAQMTNDK